MATEKNPSKIKQLFDTEKVYNALLQLVDRGDKILDIVLKGGVAYAGYTAMQHPMGAVFSLLGLHLARSRNLAAGAAGVTMLAGVGITDIIRAAALVPRPNMRGPGIRPEYERPPGLKE